MTRKRTGVVVTKARAPLGEDFERMLGELAAAGGKMFESEVESLVAEAVAKSRRKVRAAHGPECRAAQAVIFRRREDPGLHALYPFDIMISNMLVREDLSWLS